MRNKKTKSDYHKKRQLLTSYEFYKAKHKKLPVSKDEYQTLKDDILILENLYPSIKKISTTVSPWISQTLKSYL